MFTQVLRNMEPGIDMVVHSLREDVTRGSALTVSYWLVPNSLVEIIGEDRIASIALDQAIILRLAYSLANLFNHRQGVIEEGIHEYSLRHSPYHDRYEVAFRDASGEYGCRFLGTEAIKFLYGALVRYQKDTQDE